MPFGRIIKSFQFTKNGIYTGNSFRIRIAEPGGVEDFLSGILMKNHRLQSYREIDFAVSAFSPVANRFLPDIPADSIKPSLEWTLRISEKFPRGILEIKPLP